MKYKRLSPLEIRKDEFRRLGYQLIDSISNFIDSIDKKPVTTGESLEQLQEIIGTSSLPEDGLPVQEILSRATDLLLNHSLLNGHPKFLGYVTSSATPIGALADLLASAVNPNVGANILSPVATEIEKQTIKWLVEYVGLSPNYGGTLVSGGNIANFTGFLAARTVKAPSVIKEDGISNDSQKLVVYCSEATHTWIEKAAILFGLGSRAIHWIKADSHNKIEIEILDQTIQKDLKNDFTPIMVVGTAGDVSTGAVDDLARIASICKKFDLWFHVDGAYGLPAIVVPEQRNHFKGIEEADSIALDPHKWLYSPLEAACVLIKNPNHLIQTFSTHPAYYNFDNYKGSKAQNYYEYGLQNSRGFKALKVWLAFQQVGRQGYEKMISQDIYLSKLLFDLANKHQELEAITHNLSISTLRYVPLNDIRYKENYENYLNTLNEDLLNELQQGGKVFISNAILKNKYCLRACIVNFRTSEKDIEEVIEIIVNVGRKIHAKLQGKNNTMSI